VKHLEKIDGTVTASPHRFSAKDRLNGFWNVFNKEDNVLILICADPDAISSALTLKRLLRYRVKNVTIAYPNKITRLNNITMVERLKIEMERCHTLVMEDYTKKILVDSQPNHMPCFEKFNFDVVIDHHPITSGWDADFIDIRPEYGAVASMMVEYLRAADMKPSVSLATALFYGIKVDTSNFEKKAQLADGRSFRYLFSIANRNLVRKFELSELRRSELRFFKLALDELLVSKRRAYVHLGKVNTPDILVIIADFLNQVDQLDWVLVSGINGSRLTVIFRCDGYRKHAGKLAKRIFDEYGSAGGHKEAARAEVPLKNLPLRENLEFTTRTLKRLATNHMK